MGAIDSIRDQEKIERDVREGRDPELARLRAMKAREEGIAAFERGDWATMGAKVEEELYWKARYPQERFDVSSLDDPAPVFIGGGQAVTPADGRYVS